MKYSATWKHIQCTALHTGSQMANNNNKSQVLGFFSPSGAMWAVIAVQSRKPTLITHTPQLLVSRCCGVGGLMLFHEAISISFTFIIFLWFNEDKYIGFASNFTLSSIMAFFFLMTLNYWSTSYSQKTLLHCWTFPLCSTYCRSEEGVYVSSWLPKTNQKVNVYNQVN